MRNKPDHRDPHLVLNYIKKLANEVDKPAFEIEKRQDIRINIRVDEKIGAAKFKPDPLIPHGYIANSLTIKAMRQDIFVLGETTEDLEVFQECACGESLDVQFWKLCPYCGRSLNL